MRCMTFPHVHWCWIIFVLILICALLKNQFLVQNHGYSTAVIKENYVGGIDFEVTSQFRNPVLLLKLLGHSDDGSPMVKLVILRDGNEDGNRALDLRNMNLIRKNVKLGFRSWKILYHLKVDMPLVMENLTFSLSWRVEYSSFKDSLKNYPTKICSFQGASQGSGYVLPNFRLVSLGPFLHNGTIGSALSKADSWNYRHSLSKDGLKDVNNMYMFCRPFNKSRPYSIAVVGDSQPSYMCQYLQLNGNLPTRCITLKGEYVKGKDRLIDFSNAYLSALQDLEEDIIIFNPQGLWETAYGQLNLFSHMLDKLLKFIDATNTPRYFFLTTTAVHPINYTPGIFNDTRKWAMTQPRVSAINQIAKQRIQLLAPKTVRVIDVEALTLLQEDDPMVQGDMRHYGNRTNEMILSHMLCQVDQYYYQNLTIEN